MNILLTNDDGIESSSLQPLAAKLRKLGRVMIVVPDQERSGASHSITLSKPLRLVPIKKDVYTLDGTPTDCVEVVLQGGLGKIRINLVVSGINRGPNLCEDVFYSGTVAAAREGALFGIPSLAVSLDSFAGKPDYRFGISFVTKFIAENSFYPGQLLNINIPDLPAEKIKGVAMTRLGWRRYKDVLYRRKDPWGNPYFWMQGKGITYSRNNGDDCAEVKKGYVSITPLGLDLTNLTDLEILGKKLKGVTHG